MAEGGMRVEPRTV